MSARILAALLDQYGLTDVRTSEYPFTELSSTMRPTLVREVDGEGKPVRVDGKPQFKDGPPSSMGKHLKDKLGKDAVYWEARDDGGKTYRGQATARALEPVTLGPRTAGGELAECDPTEDLWK